MSRRLTPQQQIDREMQKLKAMGVTITVTPGNPGDDISNRPAGVIAEAARRNGIYGKGTG